MKRPINLLYLLFLSLFFSACHNDEEWTATSGFRISLGDEPVSVGTRATPAEIGKPAAAQFHLKITSHKTGAAIYDAAYTTAVIPASTGTYSLTASYGDNPVLAWDTPYYEGNADAEIEADKTASVTIPCSVANSLLSVQFSNIDKFDTYYSSYGVKVKIGNTSLHIEKDNAGKSAYFRAGSELELTFCATLQDNGQEVSIPIKSDKLPAVYEAGTHTKLSLTAAIPASGTILTVDKVETEKVTVSETIPMEWLPKPKVAGFGESNTLEYVETADAPANAVISYTTSSPVQDVVFTLDFKDAQYTKYNKTYTLSEMTEEERTVLSNIGIALPVIDGISQEGKIDLKALTANLITDAGSEVTHTMNVKVKANNRWSSEAGEEYQIKVVKPEFSVGVYPGNIWTKEFTINALMESGVESGKFEKLSNDMSYQFSEDGTNWVTLGNDLRKDGLKPGTPYYIRGIYRGCISGKVSTVTTYKAIALDNGGLEGATITTGADGKSGQNRGARYAWNGWATTNPLSTPDCHAAAYAHNSRSGVRPTTDKPSQSSSENAVRIITTGYGYGSTYNNLNNFIHSELFLGTEPEEDKDNRIYGIQFASHPTGIGFYYKCISNVGNDLSEVRIELYHDDVLLGNGIFQTAAKSDYEYKVLPIIYSTENEKLLLEPNKISVIFKSGTKSDLSMSDLKKMFGSNNFITGNTNTTADCMWRGNELFINDVSLIYDK